MPCHRLMTDPATNKQGRCSPRRCCLAICFCKYWAFARSGAFWWVSTDTQSFRAWTLSLLGPRGGCQGFSTRHPTEHHQGATVVHGTSVGFIKFDNQTASTGTGSLGHLTLKPSNQCATDQAAVDQPSRASQDSGCQA